MSQLDKFNIWGKVKTSTKTITSSIGGLSIRSEHDGDAPESTIIHKALVNHYTEEGQGYPEWLGHVDQKSQQKLSLQNNPIVNPIVNTLHPLTQQLTDLKPDPNKYRRQYSFSAPTQSTNTPSTSHTPLTASPSKNRMKDRLKRHNYRNEFVTE